MAVVRDLNDRKRGELHAAADLGDDAPPGAWPPVRCSRRRCAAVSFAFLDAVIALRGPTSSPASRHGTPPMRRRERPRRRSARTARRSSGVHAGDRGRRGLARGRDAVARHAGCVMGGAHSCRIARPSSWWLRTVSRAASLRRGSVAEFLVASCGGGEEFSARSQNQDDPAGARHFSPASSSVASTSSRETLKPSAIIALRVGSTASKSPTVGNDDHRDLSVDTSLFRLSTE